MIYYIDIFKNLKEKIIFINLYQFYQISINQNTFKNLNLLKIYSCLIYIIF